MKKRLLSAILFLSFCLVGLWAKEDIRIINPVLPGDRPDPSITLIPQHYYKYNFLST